MAKLTRQQEQAHDDALALLSLGRRLDDDETEFVFRNYRPMANHRVTKGGIFFTPYELAGDFAASARLHEGGTVIDLAAGIGVLTHHMILMERWDNRDDAKRHTCIEIEPEFVEVGKKLVPEAEWIRGNIFDLDLLESLGTFTMGIANPPFGNLPSLAPARAWMKAQVPAHLAACEVIVRMCNLGGFAILPRDDVHSERHQVNRDPRDRLCISSALKRFYTAFPGLEVTEATALDYSRYKFDGANPPVVVADICVDEAEIELPYGFADGRAALSASGKRTRVRVAPDHSPRSKPSGGTIASPDVPRNGARPGATIPTQLSFAW